MTQIKDKNIVVLGASRGVGREIALRARAEGGRVLAVARGEDELRRLAGEAPGIDILALDAASEDAPARIFATMTSRHSRGLRRRPAAYREHPGHVMERVHDELGMRRQNVVSLLRPRLADAAQSGIGRHSDFKRRRARRLADFGRLRRRQAHADVPGRLRAEGIRPARTWASLCCVAPLRIMPETALGKAAVEGYARYLGIPIVGFCRGHDRSAVSGRCRGCGHVHRCKSRNR